MARIILFNKPFRVLSQFTGARLPDGRARATLADYLDAPGFRVAGRLDYDSEGLLLLTDDGILQQRIANPKHKLWKVYLAQVEGEPDDAALGALRGGMTLRDGPTLPARVRRVRTPVLWERQPPVRRRQSVADCWLEIALREGRNRQVRRMTAAAGHPTLRLVRTRVGDWDLGELAPGRSRAIEINMPLPSPAPRRARR